MSYADELNEVVIKDIEREARTDELRRLDDLIRLQAYKDLKIIHRDIENRIAELERE